MVEMFTDVLQVRFRKMRRLLESAHAIRVDYNFDYNAVKKRAKIGENERENRDKTKSKIDKKNRSKRP